MSGTLSAGQIETLLADVWIFSHAGRAVQASLSFEEPERVLLMAVGGVTGAVIEWDILADLLHAGEHGSDVANRRALGAVLGQILDSPTAFGGASVDTPAASRRGPSADRG